MIKSWNLKKSLHSTKYDYERVIEDIMRCMGTVNAVMESSIINAKTLLCHKFVYILPHRTYTEYKLYSIHRIYFFINQVHLNTISDGMDKVCDAC